MTRATDRNDGNTSLKRRSRRGDPMTSYDQLPPELRLWVAQATLPWSPHSTLRAWRRALRTCGDDVELAKETLKRIERRQVARDARKIWGRNYAATLEVRP